MGPALKSGLHPQGIPLEKTNFFICKCFLNGGSFWVKDGGLCTLLSMLRLHLVQTPASNIYVSSVFTKALFPWFPSSPLALKLFLPHLA